MLEATEEYKKPSSVVEVQYVTDEGYKATVIFHDIGHRCGYVSIPLTHKAANLSYYNSSSTNEVQKYINDNILVHGGLTYSEKEDEYYTYGFDCVHSFDRTDYESISNYGFDNRIAVPTNISHGIIRTLKYCIDECNSLSKQLYEIDTNDAL